MKRLNWSLGPQATANFGLVLVVLVFNSVVVHRNTIALSSAQASINHAHEVFTRSQVVFSSLNDANANVDEYVLTGDESLLADDRQLSAVASDQVRLLRDATADNPKQRERVEEIARQIESRFAHLQSVVATGAAEGLNAARDRMIAGGGKDSMFLLQKRVADLQATESELIAAQSHEQKYRLFVVLGANLAAVIVGVTLTIVAWYLVERELRKRRAAEAIAQSERQNLWVTLTSIADGVIVSDSKGRVRLVNPIAQELLGNPPDVMGRPVSEIFSTVDEATREPVENPVIQVLNPGSNANNTDQTILKRMDGREIPISQSVAPIRDSAGSINGVVFVFRDCTEQRQIERELSERERRFRRVFETPLIGIAIGTSQGSLLEANDVYLDLIGYRPGQLGVTELSWDGKPHGQSPLDDTAQIELREQGVCKPIERTYTQTDGTRVPVLISAARLMDEQNRIVIFVTDLSQSKRAESALRESEARFRVLSECMPQKVWTAKPDGQFDYLNNMLLEYAGTSADELTAWGWTNLIHVDDVQVYLSAWKQSISTGDMFEIEHRFRKHTGEYRWHLARALPVYKTDGQTAMWVGTNTDIHDQKQAEEALREEHRRKDHFLALLAHELRNPLAPLSNAIQVFPSVQNDPASSGALIGIMQRQVRQMTRLIDDLLDLARITTGRMRLRRERIVADAVVAAAVETVQPFISEKHHQFTMTVPEEQLWLDADSARLAQVLTNLLHNAAKYTDSHGQLSLIVERSGAEVVFRIRDNGAGISEEMLTKIFDLFTQAESTLDRAHGGLGIGLTLARTLVELHDGTITASSEGIGFGSEFVVRLPLIGAPLVPVSTTVDHNNESPTSLPVFRVLVVDDVQASAKTFALMLKTLGQDVDVAFDGATAIARIRETPFDLVFLDIAMPGMDGLEVARRLRANPDLRSLTLVALTGFGQDEDRAHSLQAGFNEHLTKPTSLDLLRGVLQRAAEAATNSSDRQKDAREC